MRNCSPSSSAKSSRRKSGIINWQGTNSLTLSQSKYPSWRNGYVTHTHLFGMSNSLHFSRPRNTIFSMWRPSYDRSSSTLTATSLVMAISRKFSSKATKSRLLVIPGWFRTDAWDCVRFSVDMYEYNALFALTVCIFRHAIVCSAVTMRAMFQ